MKAVIAYEKRLSGSRNLTNGPKFDHELERKRNSIVRSFSIARNMYSAGREKVSDQESELETGAQFLEVYIHVQTGKYFTINLTDLIITMKTILNRRIRR